MSVTGFHPEPSAKAPWIRTTVLTAAYAGDDAARAAPVRRARIKRFMVQLRQYWRQSDWCTPRCEYKREKIRAQRACIMQTREETHTDASLRNTPLARERNPSKR